MSLGFLDTVFAGPVYLFMGFPGGASGKEPICQCRRFKRYVFDPWIGKIPWKRKQQPTPVFLAGEPHGQRSPAGYNGASKVGHDLATKPPCIQTEFVYIGQVTAYLINAIKDIFNINNIT